MGLPQSMRSAQEGGGVTAISSLADPRMQIAGRANGKQDGYAGLRRHTLATTKGQN